MTEAQSKDESSHRLSVVEPVERAIRPKLKKKFYEAELRRFQQELVKLQESIVERGLRVVVVFEGRDAAGKGGVIKRITERLNPRIARVTALGTPTEREKTQWWCAQGSSSSSTGSR